MGEVRAEEDDRGQQELGLRHLLKNLKQMLDAINGIRGGE
jgi:hypothetical protein